MYSATPGGAVEMAPLTERIEKLPSAESSAQGSKLKLQIYVAARSRKGIHGIRAEHLHDMRSFRSANTVHTLLHVRFMVEVTHRLKLEWYKVLVNKNSKNNLTSRMIILHFVNLQPTSLDAGYTPVMFAAGV